jgi:methylated-DNA-protein-cysteine methyltransferase-like protein
MPLAGIDRERIWSVVRRIPPGRVATYGQVAREAGLGRGARQVGRALAALKDRDDVPWHRVINAQGRISLPPGSAARAEQQARLAAEGIEVASGKVSLARYRWQPSLDELLWRQPLEGDG